MNKVLIIEDDEAIRSSTRDLLIDSGYEVSVASNGEEGLIILRSEPLPSVILLDLMMPIKDGFEFRQQQELDPRISHIPVIIMTADGHTQAKQLKTHAIDYIKKPFDVEMILTRVEKHCH